MGDGWKVGLREDDGESDRTINIMAGFPMVVFLIATRHIVVDS